MQALTLTDLLTRGAQVSINAASYQPISLTGFAGLAKRNGGLLIIRNASKLLPISLAGIAAAGQNNVRFEFT
jgi:hypothetical protein